MKILFLSEFFPTEYAGEMSGGSEARTYYVALELSKRGHEVTVVTSLLPQAKRLEMWQRLRVVRVGPERRYTKGGALLPRFNFFLETIKKGREQKWDIVDGNTIVCYLSAYLIGTLTKARSVIWIPDLPGVRQWAYALGLLDGLIAAFLEWFSVHLPVDKIIALSETTKKKTLAYSVAKAKIVRIYPGFVKTKFGGRTRNISNKRTLSLIAVQRLVNYKRTDLVVDALSTDRLLNRKILFDIIGEGEEMSKLKKMIAESNMGNKISLLGNMPHLEVLERINESDIFTLPSQIEGFGYVTLEAMSLGLPFVNSDIPVHREILQASGAGLLFRAGDSRDFASKLQQLIDSPSLYRKLSRCALSFSKNLTWEACARETERLYVQITKEQ